jgi:hypothetical protein
MVGSTLPRFLVRRKCDFAGVLGGLLRWDRRGICLRRGFSRSDLGNSSAASSGTSREEVSLISVASDGIERSVEAADNALLSTNVERRKSRNESTSSLVDMAPRLTRTIL